MVAVAKPAKPPFSMNGCTLREAAEDRADMFIQHAHAVVTLVTNLMAVETLMMPREIIIGALEAAETLILQAAKEQEDHADLVADRLVRLARLERGHPA